ncbi:MAG: S8 family serine peptidase [Solirubrobacterales bacterium]|nr:S8 family serine peptidase [Solirubrobacterales bacterium]
MRDFKDQTGEARRRARPSAFGELPVLLILLAVVSVTILGLATVSIAAAEPIVPMILPSDATSSASGSTLGSSASGWIVGGVPGARTKAIARRAGATPIAERLGSYSVSRSKARTLARKLSRAGRLVYAEPDVGIQRSGYPLDLLSDQQWWLNRIVSPTDVTPPTVTDSSPLIALIEESLDARHPDLVGANLTGAKSKDPAADTHGTSIAGIIGSPGEMSGIRGVWPGARMRLFPSGLTCSTASKAVAKAATKGAAVINMSYTFPSDVCFTHFMATQYAVRKGAIPVAAAGNSGDSGNGAMRPASDPHVLSVGAVDDKSVIASFSTRNSAVDLVAPGQGVLAPVVKLGASGSPDYSWEEVKGTSFSAPMVAAAAAWVKQARPQLGNLQVQRLLTDSATDLGDPGRDPSYGAGMLSIEGSLAGPTPPSDPYEPNDDIPWIDGSYLKTKAPFLWKVGKGPRRMIKATLSKDKDPADVYKVSVPGRRRIAVNVAQLEGDVVLAALKPKAKTIVNPGKKLIVRSNRPYPKTEGIVVRNLKKKPQTIWIAITPSATQTGEYSRYKLTVARR